MFGTVKNSLGSNWPHGTPTLNIEWGQIDPKGNRRVKRLRICQEGFSTLQVPMEAIGQGKGLTTAPCGCFPHGPVVHLIILSLSVLHINKANPTIAASFISRYTRCLFSFLSFFLNSIRGVALRCIFKRKRTKKVMEVVQRMMKESLREKFKEMLLYLQVLRLLANQRLEWMWRVVGCQGRKSFSKCVNSEDVNPSPAALSVP